MRRQIAAGLVALALAVTAASESSRPAPEPAAVSLQAAPTATPKPAGCSGWPGGMNWYCELHDASIRLYTWLRGDGLVSIDVCERAGRYNQTLELSLVWTALSDRSATLPLTSTSTLWQPSAAQPCLQLLVSPLWPDRPSPNPDGKWRPDVRVDGRTWRYWAPWVAKGETK